MRLGDLDELEHYFMTQMRYLGKDQVMDAAYMVNKAPTVDAVPVVRCKNCVNGTVCENLQGAEYVDCVLDDYSVRMPDDFCSYGERKDGGS